MYFSASALFQRGKTSTRAAYEIHKAYEIRKKEAH